MNTQPSPFWYTNKPGDGRRYQYRNLPADIREHPWCVQGSDVKGGGGVLEWCYDEQDAQAMLALMQAYPEFSDLSIGPWD